MNKLFHTLPPIIKNFATSAIAIYKNHEKYGKVYKEYYIKLRNDNFKNSIDDLLEQFIEYSINNSRFYSNYEHTNIYVLPILKKSDIIESNYLNIIGNPYKITHSSGTTGRPFKIPITKNAYQIEYAFWWYHRSFAGLKKGDKVASFAGHKVTSIHSNQPPFWVYNYYDNQIIFSSYHLSNVNLKYYIDELNKFKPKLLHGYPSSIYLVAKYALENNIKFHFIPKMIQTGSETLLDFQRETIEKAFKCKVYNWYGNTELCGHITECQYGNLHIQPRHSYVRIIKDDETEAKAGETGRIVATNYNNACFPLINYDTEDIVQISKKQECECGQNGTIIESIDGRIEDYIFLPDGRKVGRLDHIFKHTNNVKKAQIVQNKIDEVIIRINRNRKYSTSNEKEILKEARERLGNKINIELDYDTEITKEENGKFRFIKQNIKKKDL